MELAKLYGDDKKCMTCDLHELITFLNINQVDTVGHTSVAGTMFAGEKTGSAARLACGAAPAFL